MSDFAVLKLFHLSVIGPALKRPSALGGAAAVRGEKRKAYSRNQQVKIFSVLTEDRGEPLCPLNSTSA